MQCPQAPAAWNEVGVWPDTYRAWPPAPPGSPRSQLSVHHLSRAAQQQVSRHTGLLHTNGKWGIKIYLLPLWRTWPNLDLSIFRYCWSSRNTSSWYKRYPGASNCCSKQANWSSFWHQERGVSTKAKKFLQHQLKICISHLSVQQVLTARVRSCALVFCVCLLVVRHRWDGIEGYHNFFNYFV